MIRSCAEKRDNAEQRNRWGKIPWKIVVFLWKQGLGSTPEGSSFAESQSKEGWDRTGSENWNKKIKSELLIHSWCQTTLRILEIEFKKC